MWGRPGALVVALSIVVAALVPVFGDPRTTPVTHPIWARLLLRALELQEAVRTSRHASQVFSMLSWRDSLSLSATDYLRADGALFRTEAGHPVARASSVPAEVTYAVAVVQPGDYLLRARLSGAPESPVAAEIRPLSGGAAPRVLSFSPVQQMQWVFGGSAHLDPGAYETQFLLPPGSALSRVEIAPPCLHPIEPPGGWQTTGVTTADDLAVTTLRAIDTEDELSPAASPLEMTGAEFRVEAPADAVVTRASADAFSRETLAGGLKGLLAVTTFEVEQEGLYTISAFTLPGAGQRWVLDGCRKAVVCASTVVGWRLILAQPLAPGRHLLALTLGADGNVSRLRIERKKRSPADYVSALKRLGFDPGPPGPVSRATALDAAEFIRNRRRSFLAEFCGDPVTIEEEPPQLAVREPSERGESAPAAKPPEVIEPPNPVFLPPQSPATPTQPLGS